MASSSSSSSLPSSASSPRIRYFDLLPPELLTYVLNHIDASPRYDAKTRQKTLYSLCLTSKILHELSRPLLLKHIQTSIGAGENLMKLLVTNNGDEMIAKVQSFHFDTPHVDNKQRWLVKIAREAVSLRNLYVFQLSAVVKAFVCTNITTLSLHVVILRPNDIIITLPELRHLSVADCRVLDRLSCPKLKHLAYVPRTFDGPLEGILLCTQFCPQLASFTTDLPLLAHLPSSIFGGTSTSQLFRTSFEEHIASSWIDLKHLYFTLNPGVGGFYGSLAGVRLWTKLLSDCPHGIESVYLATYEGGGGVIRPKESEVVLAFISVCIAQDIQVHWVERDDSYTFDNLVPASFIKKSEACQASKQLA